MKNRLLAEEEKLKRNLEQLNVLVTDKKGKVLYLASINRCNGQLNDKIKQAEAVTELNNSNINLQSLSESITPKSTFRPNEKLDWTVNIAVPERHIILFDIIR